MSTHQISCKWLLYVMGIFGLLLINSAVVTMSIYRYDLGIPNPDNLPFLVPFAFVGIAMLVSRLGGSISQPVIGHMSDRYRSRWGRRRPLGVMAIVPMVVSFYLLLTPPLNHSILENMVYLIALLCCLRKRDRRISGFLFSLVAEFNPNTRTKSNSLLLDGDLQYVGGCGLIFIGVLPLLVGQALMPWLLLLLLSNLGSSNFFILPNAMLPDVIARDEQKFRVRREAIFFGARGFVQNISPGMGVFLAGIILMLGKTPAQRGGVQLAFPIAGIFAEVAAWAFVFYPIEE